MSGLCREHRVIGYQYMSGIAYFAYSFVKGLQ